MESKDLQGFGKRLNHYFFEELGLKNQREISKMLGNFSETQISRLLKQEKISLSFIKKIKEHIPNADTKYLMGELFEEENNKGNVASEPTELYGKERMKMELIEDIEVKLQELKALMTQK